MVKKSNNLVFYPVLSNSVTLKRNSVTIFLQGFVYTVFSNYHLYLLSNMFNWHSCSLIFNHSHKAANGQQKSSLVILLHQSRNSVTGVFSLFLSPGHNLDSNFHLIWEGKWSSHTSKRKIFFHSSQLLRISIGYIIFQVLVNSEVISLRFFWDQFLSG